MKKKHTNAVKHTTLWIFTGFFIIVVILFIVTKISLSSLEQSNQRLEKLVEKTNVKSELMYSMREAIWKRRSHILVILTVGDPFLVEEHWEKFSAQVGTFLRVRKQLVELGLTTIEENAIVAQYKKLNNNRTMLNKLMKRVRAGEELATSEILEEVFQNGVDIIAGLDEMIIIGHATAQHELLAARQEYQQTRSDIIILNIVAGLLCFAIIYVLVQRIRYKQNELTVALSIVEQDNDLLEDRVLERTQDLMLVRDEALEASKTKSRFLANMSHELRTPLNAVIGYSEMLIDDVEESGEMERYEDLHKIQSAGQHLLKLIDDILDISKVEAGKLQVSPEHFYLYRLIQEVTEIVHPLIEQKDNKFVLNFDDDITEVYCDPTRIRQILFNLLSNAAKFTEEGEIRLDIERELDGEDAWIIYRITDTGIGISDPQMQKLFQAFSQIDASSTRKYGGTGLGLVISLRFCELMGGSIYAQSLLGEGSTFTVRLPEDISKMPNYKIQTEA